MFLEQIVNLSSKKVVPGVLDVRLLQQILALYELRNSQCCILTPTFISKNLNLPNHRYDNPVKSIPRYPSRHGKSDQSFCGCSRGDNRGCHHHFLHAAGPLPIKREILLVHPRWSPSLQQLPRCQVQSFRWYGL
jgi:hypothetical protein